MSNGIDTSQVIKSNNALSTQDATQALYRASVPFSPSQGSANGTQNDSVQLSQEGNFLNGVTSGKLEWGLPVKTLPPIPHTAEQLNAWINDFRDGVRKTIEHIFAQNDVQLQQPVTLQSNGDGKVQVAGQHPQAKQIQKLVDQAPQIGDQLQSLNQRSELYQVLSHGNNLRQASNDGEHSQAAAALSEHLNNPTPIRLTVSPSSSSGATSSTSQT